MTHHARAKAERDRLLAYLEENPLPDDPLAPFLERMSADLGWTPGQISNRLHRLRVEGAIAPSLKPGRGMTAQELALERAGLWHNRPAPAPLEFVCDRARHLICLPYSIDNLHRMADELGIGRHWFHVGSRLQPCAGRLAHYDIPKKRIAAITARCRVVNSREIVHLIKEALKPCEWCSRRDPHTHCPECGDTSHVAAQCDAMG